MQLKDLISQHQEKSQQEYHGAPDWLRSFSQPLLRWILLHLANYNVTIDDPLPQEPSLLLAYPHGEHANSILLPSHEITYVAARDTFFKSAAQQYLLSLILNMVPISRDEDFSRESLAKEVSAMQQVVQQKHHHLLVYPQGTRRGAAEGPEQLCQQLKPGIHLIAKQIGLPVVPMGIVYEPGYDPQKGTTDVWRETQRAIRQGKRPPKRNIHVRIGDPISLENKHRKVFLAELATILYQLVHSDLLVENVMSEPHR